VYGISIIGTRLATGRILDKGNRSRLVTLAFIAMALGLVGYAFAHSQLVLLPCTVLIGIGSGILHPVLIAVHMERMPENEKGRASAAFYLAFDLGIGLGMWLLSPALAWFSLREVFLIAGLAALAGVTLVQPVTARLKAVNQPG
jgi:predicted MFS family arabinose efflux permease